MTSAMTIAQAYGAWLNIPPSATAPHHYALLGLPLHTADAQAIFQAYQQRSALVGQHLSGPHAATALALLGELAGAQACLLNAETRAAYDRTLAARAGATATAAQGAATAASAKLQRPAPRGKAEPPAASAPAGEEVAPPPFSPYHENDEPTSMLPWLVGGVCAGILAVAVLGAALFAFGRKEPRDGVAKNTKASSQRREGRERQERATRLNDASAERDERDGFDGDDGSITTMRDDDVLGERVAPLTTPPERLDEGIIGSPTGADETIIDSSTDSTDDAGDAPAGETTATEPAATSASPEPETPAATTSTAAALPRSIALPSRDAAGGSGMLAALKAKDAASVKLALDASGLAGSGKFALAAEVAGAAPGERVWPVQHAVGNGAPRTVGQYSLAGDELSFRWGEGAQASDDVLANAALAVTVDGEVVQINQRTPDAVAPLKLAVDVGAISTSAKIDSPPQGAKLYFALDGQNESFPAHQLQPEDPVAAGQEIDLIFGEATDPYRLALRVSLSDNGAGGVRIEARPMFQNVDEGLKWDYFRAKAVAQALAQRKQQEALVDAQLQQLQQRYGRNALQLQQAMEIFNRQTAELQTRVLALETIHALCEELNASGALNYRVFAKFGDREVDLIDSTLGITLPAAEVPAEPEADDADGIVGPPTTP